MNLAEWRRRIDEIDKKLVELLNERSRCALEIGKIKQEAHIPLYQPERENEVLANAENNNSGPLTEPFAACSNASSTKRAPPNETPWIPMAPAAKKGMNERFRQPELEKL